ncbi:MAG: TSUP family transporter [Oscillospiraceae bacterium]|nr:TSUP family transporter [Oscillospiraceae bacterium]
MSASAKNTIIKCSEGMVEILKKNYKLITIGALAGAANGFFGAGGGLFLVPLFVRWLEIEEKKAFATSVAVIFPLSAISLIVYFLKVNINIIEYLPILLGGLAGGLIAGQIFGKISVTLLRRVFGILIIYGGIRAVLLI